MKKAARLLGLLVALVAGYYFLRQAVTAWGGADLGSLLSWRSAALAGAALLIYLLQVPLAAVIWRWILRDVGVQLSAASAYAVIASTQFAKYLPGNVAQHIGRVAVARSFGGDMPRLTLSLVYETLIALLAGIHVTVVFLTLRPVPVMERWLPMESKSLFVAIATAGAASAFLLLPRLMAYAQRRGWLNAGGGSGFRLTFSKLSLVYGAFVVGFLLLGLAFTLLAHAVAPEGGFPFVSLCGAFAAAWVVGLLVPGAPAGLGVREGILVALLSGVTGNLAGIAAIALLRLVTTLGDLLHFLFGMWLLRTTFSTRPSTDAT